MTENVIEFPEDKPPQFMIGPFKSYPVVIEGRKIPRLEAWEEGENTFILVDGRICISVPNKHAYDVCFITATALAVGSGYSHIGAETKDRCFAPQCSEINLES